MKLNNRESNNEKAEKINKILIVTSKCPTSFGFWIQVAYNVYYMGCLSFKIQDSSYGLSTMLSAHWPVV